MNKQELAAELEQLANSVPFLPLWSQRDELLGKARRMAELDKEIERAGGAKATPEMYAQLMLHLMRVKPVTPKAESFIVAFNKTFPHGQKWDRAQVTATLASANVLLETAETPGDRQAYEAAIEVLENPELYEG